MSNPVSALLMVIDSFDGMPSGGYEPMTVELGRQLASNDGSEYWIGKLQQSITYEKDGKNVTVNHVVVAPGWVGQSFSRPFEGGRVNLAYVIDESLLEDESIDFSKADYVAFGSGKVIAKQHHQQAFGFE